MYTDGVCGIAGPELPVHLAAMALLEIIDLYWEVPVVISTRKVDALVAALGVQSGISKSQVSRICQEIDQQVRAFLNRPLQESGYAYVYLDATYLHGRLGGLCRSAPEPLLWPWESTPTAAVNC